MCVINCKPISHKEHFYFIFEQPNPLLNMPHIFLILSLAKTVFCSHLLFLVLMIIHNYYKLFLHIAKVRTTYFQNVKVGKKFPFPIYL